MKTKQHQSQRQGKARKPSVTYLKEMPQGVLLFTKPQMAAMLQVSERCLHEMMHRGEVSYLKIGGKIVRFQSEEVVRRLKETVGVCKDKDEGGNLKPE
jgi:predicted DNA-binding transcriptional regulator AlpA